MPTILVALAVLIGFAASFGISNTFSWRLDEQDRSARYFGLLCFGLSAYAALQFSILTTSDLSSAAIHLRWQGVASALTLMALVRFGAAFSRRRIDHFDRFCLAVYAALGAWSLASPSGYWFSSLSALEPMPTANGFLYHPRGPFAWTYYVSITLQLPLSARQIVDGQRAARLGFRVDGWLWSVCMLIFLLGAIHDHMVDFRLLAPPYLGEYAFPLVVLTMGTRYARRRSLEFERLRQLQDALAQSESKLRDLFESSSDAIIIHDVSTGAILEVNRTTCEMYGYTREQFRTLSIQDISAHHPDFSGARVQERLNEALHLGITTFSRQAQRSDQSVFPVEVTLKRAELGGKTCIVANVRDQTERATNIEALRQEKNFVDTLIDSLPGTFCLADRSLRLKRWNRNLELALGYTSEQVGAMSMADWHLPEQRDALRLEMRDWFESDRPNLQRESRIIRADGTEVSYRVTATKLDTPDGTALMAVGIDISDLLRAQAALREGEERYRTLFGCASDAILLLCQDRIVDCNESALTVFGCEDSEQLIGHTPIDFSPSLQPNERASDLASLERMQAAESGLPQRFEWLHQRPNGQLFLAEVSLNRVDLRGTRHLQAIVRDITERRRLEERLQQAQRLEAIGHLAGGVAHDFNNLLTPIVGHAELVLDELTETHPAREDILQVLSAAGRARQLTQQLLSVGRRSVLQVRAVDIGELIIAMRELLQSLLRENIELQIALESTAALVVEADPSQIEQVMMNLVVNARDAMPRGGQLRITVTRKQLDAGSCAAIGDCVPGPHAVVSVSDTGVGMTQELQRRIFEPFFTTKAAGRGTGLGLPTVLGLVRQHRGALTVRSELGVGSTFCVYLPVSQRHPIVEPPASCSSRAKAGTESILVVEDDEMVRAYTHRALEKTGYHVTEAESAEQALVLLNGMADPPHLVITDVVLPKMSGRDLAERLRQECPACRVLYMSGYSDDIISHHGILNEGVIMIQKPFSSDQLMAKVRAALDAK